MIWAIDENIDVAALVLSDETFDNVPPMKLGDSDQAQIGENIVVIGNPLGFENVAGQGIISSKKIDYTEGDVSIPYIMISSNIAPGNSGGPVIRTRDNTVIGIAAATISAQQSLSSGLNAAVPINEVKRFLSENRINFASG